MRNRLVGGHRADTVFRTARDKAQSRKRHAHILVVPLFAAPRRAVSIEHTVDEAQNRLVPIDHGHAAGAERLLPQPDVRGLPRPARRGKGIAPPLVFNDGAVHQKRVVRERIVADTAVNLQKEQFGFGRNALLCRVFLQLRRGNGSGIYV